MSKGEFVQAYAEGWVNGDADKILSATDDGFVFHDPDGAVSKGQFAGFFAALKETVGTIGGNQAGQPFLNISEVVTKEEDNGVLTVWCWWDYHGTPVKGSGLIKVGDTGVLSEHITHVAPHPAM